MNKKSKKHAHFQTDLTVSETFQTILRHNLGYLEGWEQSARSPEDIEGVHQTRVTFRRMRSLLTIFRPAIPKKITAEWGKTMRGLAGRLGKARDLDVFIDEALGDIRGKLSLPGEAGLETLVRQKRDLAYEDVRRMFDSEQYARFKADFTQWIDRRAWEQGEFKEKQRKLLEGNVLPFARKVLDMQERSVLETGAHVHKEAAEEMHRLRIECKKLRYAAEFFMPLFAGMDEFIGHMKGLQDLLGVMNDVAVMRGLLDEVFERVGERVGDTRVMEYAGGIVGWRTCHYHGLLEGFEHRWEEFVEAKHPWWKKNALARQHEG
jgi:CHAD domain-containing protein